MRSDVAYELERTESFDVSAFWRAVKAGDEARARKAADRRAEVEALIAAVAAARMARTEQIALELGYGGER